MLRLMILAIGAAGMFAVTSIDVRAAGKEAGDISKPYRVKVIGASMADQLATGLRWEFRGNKSFVISQETKAATGLIRKDVFDWQAAVERVVKEDEIDVAIVALGGNDRQSFFRNGRRLERFSVLWRAEYLKRLDRFMRTLTEKVPVVYWVGLPMVRAKQVTEDYQRLNSYFRDVGSPLGIVPLDIYGRFADAKGRYTAFGESLGGKRRKLRQNDGIHFTMAGARKLGNIVGQMIVADLKARRQNAKSVGAKLRGTSAQ